VLEAQFPERLATLILQLERDEPAVPRRGHFCGAAAACLTDMLQPRGMAAAALAKRALDTPAGAQPAAA